MKHNFYAVDSTALNSSADYYWAFDRQSSTFKGKRTDDSKTHSNSTTVEKNKTLCKKALE